jgi:hypothetical protein
MKRLVKWPLLVAIILIISALAFAAVNFKKGSPQLKDNGTTLSATGCITGLGNTDVVVTLTADGVPSGTCTNRGEHQPAGIQKKIRVTAGATIPADEIKNGTVCFGSPSNPVRTPEPLVAENGGCPKPFRFELDDVEFSFAQLSIAQGGQVVLERCYYVTGNNGSATFTETSCN